MANTPVERRQALDKSDSAPGDFDHLRDEMHDFSVPVFRVVWRGYDRRQVDEHIRRLQQEVENASDTLKTSATHASRPSAEFDVVLRGYDHHEVDAFLQVFPQ